jgi:hypothetical protein
VLCQFWPKATTSRPGGPWLGQNDLVDQRVQPSPQPPMAWPARGHGVWHMRDACGHHVAGIDGGASADVSSTVALQCGLNHQDPCRVGDLSGKQTRAVPHPSRWSMLRQWLQLGAALVDREWWRRRRGAHLLGWWAPLDLTAAQGGRI